jgi:hypothetical protein
VGLRFGDGSKEKGGLQTKDWSLHLSNARCANQRGGGSG